LGRGGVGRLAAWYLPCGPVGPASTWAATSNVKVGKTTYPVNRGRVGREERDGRERQSHKEEKREGGSGTGEGAKEPLGRALFGYLCRGPLLMGPVCLLSQGQFEAPRRS